MPVYRYSWLGPIQGLLQQDAPGSPTVGNISPTAYVDITLTSAGDKPDLDDAMSAIGYSYVSQDPVTTPEEASAVQNIPDFGTSAGQTCEGNDSRLSNDRTASGIRTATTVVSISGSTAPTAGQVPVANSTTAATWQFPTDPNAIHDNVGGEISVVTAKANPTAADLVLIEDSAASNAKKRATLGSLPLTAQEVSGTSSVTTTSSTAVLMAGMTITPAAGTYLVWFSGEYSASNNNVTMTASIYSGGTLVTASERLAVTSNTDQDMIFASQAIVTVNGSQAIEGRWRRSGNTLTNTRRTLTILKVA